MLPSSINCRCLLRPAGKPVSLHCQPALDCLALTAQAPLAMSFAAMPTKTGPRLPER